MPGLSVMSVWQPSGLAGHQLSMPYSHRRLKCINDPEEQHSQSSEYWRWARGICRIVLHPSLPFQASRACREATALNRRQYQRLDHSCDGTESGLCGGFYAHLEVCCSLAKSHLVCEECRHQNRDCLNVRFPVGPLVIIANAFQIALGVEGRTYELPSLLSWASAFIVAIPDRWQDLRASYADRFTEANFCWIKIHLSGPEQTVDRRLEEVPRSFRGFWYSNFQSVGPGNHPKTHSYMPSSVEV